ncbi:MAG: hypothetical protein ACJA2C_002094, partial [Marinoscillum sp.]
MVLVPLIVIIICFDYLQIKHNYLDYKDSDQLNQTLLLGVEINHVVHELQKERSMAVGFVSTEGYNFAETQNHQRQVTDSTLSEFYAELNRKDVGDALDRHENDIELIKVQFNALGEIRKRIDDHQLGPDQILEYYSDINDVALNTVDLLINETRDKEIAQQVHALIYFLKAKERASLER